MKEFCIGIVMLQCVPLKGFGSAVCVQRVRTLFEAQIVLYWIQNKLNKLLYEQ